MLLEERNYSVIEHVSRNKSILPVIQLGKSDFGVNVNDCLLVNVSDTFDVAHIISILCDKKTGIIGFYLSMSLFLFLCLLQCRNMVLVEDYAFLLHLCG